MAGTITLHKYITDEFYQPGDAPGIFIDAVVYSAEKLNYDPCGTKYLGVVEVVIKSWRENVAINKGFDPVVLGDPVFFDNN